MTDRRRPRRNQPGRETPAARDRLAYPPTLPAQPTPLVGREAEVAALRARLWRADLRLLTLTGPGGVGKTRLALATAAALADAFADGVHFVDLAPIRDPALVPAAIARALAIRETGEHSAAERLHAELRDRDLLLVLDNCEQIRGAAPLVEALLVACPALVILATSRTPLNLRAERRHPVAPLAVASVATADDPDALAAIPAIALFVACARAVRHDFALTAQNAPTIAALCARLDGLPLAIEMAAARVAVLPLRALLARLEHRFDLLRDDALDRPARHQTLRAALDWSYDLLPPRAQATLRRLAIFVGGCTVDAAEAVAGGDWAAGGEQGDAAGGDIAATLATLADSSLIRLESAGGATRVTLLETVREYAAARLRAAGEADEAARRHARYLLALAETARDALLGADQAGWLDRIERELPNIRAAVAWWAARGESAAGLRLIGALRSYWMLGAHLREVYGWLTTTFAGPRAGGEPATRAAALLTTGNLAWAIGDYATARDTATASLALFRDLGDARGQFNALTVLGNALLQLEGPAAAGSAYEEALAQSRLAGHPINIAIALTNFARVALERGDYARAAALYEESVALSRAAGNIYNLPLALTNLGFARAHQGDLAAARALFDEAIVQESETGNWRVLALTLLGLALLASDERHHARAARLLGALGSLREAIGLPAFPSERPYEERIATAARAALGPAACATAREEGRALGRAELVAYARAGDERAAPPAPPRAPAAPVPLLTRRERELLPYLARGLSNQQIAGELSIGTRTVEMHVANLLGKLELANRAQVAAWATSRGLLVAATPPA